MRFSGQKIAETIKLQNTGVKQQFAWTNKMVDDLIVRLENFKVLMEFKAKYFDRDRNTQ